MRKFHKDTDKTTIQLATYKAISTKIEEIELSQQQPQKAEIDKLSQLVKVLRERPSKLNGTDSSASSGAGFFVGKKRERSAEKHKESKRPRSERRAARPDLI